MENASRDENRVPTLLGVSSIDLVTPTRIAANPATGAMLIDGTSLYTGLDTRYLKLDQTNPQTITASPILNWMTNTSVPFIGTGGYLAQDNSNFTYNDTTDTLYSKLISTSALYVTGWTEGWVLHAGAGGLMTGESEFNYVTATNTLNVANVTATGTVNGSTLSTANLTLNTNIITSTTGLVHFNDDNLYTTGYIQANYFASDVATGTRPFQCTSTTVNTNLNADMTDSVHFSGAGYTVTIPATGTVALGTGTANYVTKWSGTNAIGNSAIQDDAATIGIGLAPQAAFHIYQYKSWGNPTATNTGFYTDQLVTPTSDTAYGLVGLGFGVTKAGGFNLGNMYALLGTVKNTGTAGTISGMYGMYVNILVGTNAAHAGTITQAVVYYAPAPARSAGTATITSMYGAYIGNQGAAFVTNAIGLEIGDQSGAGTLNIALRTNAGLIVFNEGGDANSDVRMEGDTNVNLFFLDASADKIGIGTSTPGYLLEVNGTFKANTTTPVFGDYTMTIPATGTVAMLGVANVFTTVQTVQVATATSAGMILKTTDNNTTNYLLSIQNSSGTAKTFIRADGSVDIGATSQITTTNNLLDVSKNDNASTSGTVRGARIQLRINPPSASSANYYGLMVNPYTAGIQNITGEIVGATYQVSHTSTNTLTTLKALDANIANYSGGTISTAVGSQMIMSTYGSSTTNNSFGLNIQHYIYGLATVGAAYDIRLRDGYCPTAFTSWTTHYGLYVDDHTKAATNYAIVTNAGLIVFNEGGAASSDVRMEGDTNANLFFLDASADQIGIGTATPGYLLEVNGTFKANTTTPVFSTYTLTIPATGTVALLGTANAFTNANTITYSASSVGSLTGLTVLTTNTGAGSSLAMSFGGTLANVVSAGNVFAMYGYAYVKAESADATANAAHAIQAFPYLLSEAGRTVTVSSVVCLAAAPPTILGTGLGTFTIGGVYGARIYNQGNAKWPYACGIKIEAQSGSTNNYAIVSDSGTIIFNEGGDASSDIRFESDTDVNMFYLDAGNNAVTFGSTTELAKVGIDGNADETQFKVQAHSSQTANIMEVENSAGTDLMTVDPSGNVYTPATFQGAAGFDCGDAGGFSGMKFNASVTQLEVWIDGAKIGHFAVDGTYTDDV